MRIAVFGSWKQHQRGKWGLQGSLEEFAEACRSLGEEIASCKHTVMLGSVSRNTADFYVVEGAIRVVQTQSLDWPILEVIRPSNEIRPYESEARKFPHAFVFHTSAAIDWETAHLLAIKEADSVLIIGGAPSSYHAGIACAISGKRIVPIGSFGGAGARLLDVLESTRERLHPSTPTLQDLRSLRRPWSRAQLDLAVRLLDVHDYPKLLIIHGRSQDWKDLKDYLENRLALSEPVVMSQKFGKGRTLPEKFEQLAAHLDGAIAVVTADDIGATLLDDTGQAIAEGKRVYYGRTRQNVWLEVGWFWGYLGRSKILLLCRGDVELPSDLLGVERQVYQNRPSEAGEGIRSFIEHLRGHAVD